MCWVISSTATPPAARVRTRTSTSVRPADRAWRWARRAPGPRDRGRARPPAPVAASGRRRAGGARSPPRPPARRPASTSATRRRISSRGTPRFSRPKATSSSTVAPTIWSSGSWKSRPDPGADLPQVRVVDGREPPDRAPHRPAGASRPLASRASVLLPEPLPPTKRHHLTGGDVQIDAVERTRRIGASSGRRPPESEAPGPHRPRRSQTPLGALASRRSRPAHLWLHDRSPASRSRPAPGRPSRPRHPGGVPASGCGCSLPDARRTWARSVEQRRTRSSCCAAVLMTWRRECRSPALPMVMAFSTSGRTSLALDSVVLTRPCSSTEQARLASICRRWSGCMPNLLPFL